MSPDAIIELTNARICQQDHLVLSDVNISIKNGEFVYLIGKTGSGKTSLLQTLYCDLSLPEGSGNSTGYDLQKIKEKEIPYLRRKLGIIFQDFQLLTDRTVSDNLIFVMKATGWKDKKKIDEHIHNILSMVGLETKGFKMPHELSGGEQQRVAIARALINDPDVILADEPTGNLDPETSKGIMELLFSISKKGRTVLMATHNYSLFKQFPARTIRCEKGKVVENGNPITD